MDDAAAHYDPVDLLPPLGRWVESGACADLPLEEADAFTATSPRPAARELAEAVCARCLVRRDCAAYAETAPVYGMWGGRWYSGLDWERADAAARRDAKRAAREAA